MCLCTFKRSLLVCLLLVVSGINNLQANDSSPVAYWDFDNVQDNKVTDSAGGKNDAITGNWRLAEGVKGKAIVMDGYTSCTTRPAKQVPEFGESFTIQAWVAPAAYPWNWAPIVSQ